MVPSGRGGRAANLLTDGIEGTRLSPRTVDGLIREGLITQGDVGTRERNNPGRTCRECGDLLVVGENWVYGNSINRQYLCIPCHNTEVRDWQRENPDKVAEKGRSSKTRLSNIRSKANVKGLAFDLTLDVYEKLISQPCVYCNRPLESTGTGLDQIIAGGGYTVTNVAPCCKYCNGLKSNLYTFEQMKIICPMLAAFRQENHASSPSGRSFTASPAGY